jgi:hypothetical protein
LCRLKNYVAVVPTEFHLVRNGLKYNTAEYRCKAPRTKIQESNKLKIQIFKKGACNLNVLIFDLDLLSRPLADWSVVPGIC